MKKLDEIPKKSVFEVPDGYFDKLPLRIQERVGSSKGSEFSFSFATTLKYTVPVIAIVAAGLFWVYNGSSKTIEEQLSTIQEEQLIAYLNDSDLSDDELTEAATLSNEDLDELEEKVYETFDNTENVLEEFANELNIEI